MVRLNGGGRKGAELSANRELDQAGFRKKVAIQQFMNHNGPLFRALALKGEDVTKAIEGQVLKEPASMANRLAMAIAARVHGKAIEDLSASDVKPFRTEAAEYVAARWVSGRKIDIDRAVAAISGAVEIADRSWDHDIYADEGISDDASLMMTVVNMSGTLSRLVEVYSFRLGTTEALSRILSTVVDISLKTARDMLKETSPSPADERNLTQTLARNFTALMEVCYDRKSREVVALLENKTPAEKRAFYASRSPIDEVIADFKAWYVCFSGWAVMAAREMAAGTSPKGPNNG
ncbi:hypothetical protein G6L37_03955 [Agrobacterium rubi]|nr:hypothetical protein [Agrobacterium rubi]NTF24504.1 hypothetical protein [Agrobacterium rubi]